MANPAINAALVAAAQQQVLAATHITGPLTKAGATSSRVAIPLDLSAKGADKLLAQLVGRGHVRDAGGGRYWLDEAAVASTKAEGQRAALILLAFLLSLGASLWALTLG
jgi:hypothetical protein